ncbi:hypothetical protein COC65_03150 [Bacillus thuringiensis]|nr:hypothetical protein [Bacillus thuringiensis]PGS47375.1 hypothetical protein COC65_03150 [Bacillus thuringiensis]
MTSIKVNGEYIAPKGSAICEWCKRTLKKGEWVKNNFEYGIFHKECHDEYMANEFPYDYGSLAFFDIVAVSTLFMAVLFWIAKASVYMEQFKRKTRKRKARVMHD